MLVPLERHKGGLTLRYGMLKWLNTDINYPISNSPLVSIVHVVPKKAGITVTMNDKGEELQTRLPIKWRVRIKRGDEKGSFPLTIH